MAPRRGDSKRSTLCSGNAPPKRPHTARESRKWAEQDFTRPYGEPTGPAVTPSGNTCSHFHFAMLTITTQTRERSALRMRRRAAGLMVISRCRYYRRFFGDVSIFPTMAAV